MLTLHFVGYGSTEKNLAAASNLWVVSQSKTHAAGRTVVAGMPLEVKEQKHAVYAHTHTHTPHSFLSLPLYHKEPDIISSPFRRQTINRNI